MRRGFGLLWGLVTLLVAGVVGAVAYQAGVATHVTTIAAGQVPYVEGPHFFGFGFFLFPLLLILLLVLFLRGGSHWSRGGWGPGPGGHLEQRLEDWHRRAHGESTGPSAPGGTTKV